MKNAAKSSHTIPTHLEGLLKFQAIGVIDPSVVVVGVSVEGLSGTVLLRIALVAIAVVRGAVRLPVVLAHPAELVLAAVAGHVGAAAVLLDEHATLGAVLGVDEKVVARLRVVLALAQPLLDCGTGVGRVVGQQAQEAVFGAACGAGDASRCEFGFDPDDAVALSGQWRLCAYFLQEDVRLDSLTDVLG